MMTLLPKQNPDTQKTTLKVLLRNAAEDCHQEEPRQLQTPTHDNEIHKPCTSSCDRWGVPELHTSTDNEIESPTIIATTACNTVRKARRGRQVLLLLLWLMRYLAKQEGSARPHESA